MTRTQRDNADGKWSMDRRALLRRGAAAGTAGSMAYAGADYADLEPVGEADALVISGTAIAGLATAAAIGYLGAKALDPETGPGVNSDDYEGKEAKTRWGDMRQQAVNINATDNTVMQSINNNLNVSRNAAWREAKTEAIDRMNNEASKSYTKSKAVKAVDDYYTTVQKNLAEHIAIQNQKLITMVDTNWQFIADNLSSSDIFRLTETVDGSTYSLSDFYASGSDPGSNVATRSQTLIDGSTYDWQCFEALYPSDPNISKDDNNIAGSDTDNYNGTWDRLSINPVPGESGSNEELFNMNRWWSTWYRLEQLHSDVVSNIETWVENVYPKYDSGELDSADLVNPTDIANSASGDNYAAAAASLASLGIKGGVNDSMTIKLHEADKTVKGTIFAENDKTLETGVKYNPGDVAATVWLAYQTEDGESSNLARIQQPFTIVSAEDADTGEDLEKIEFEDTEPVKETDQSIQDIKDQNEKYRKIINQLQKQEQQAATSSPFGFSFGNGGSSGLLILGGVGVAAYLLGK